MTLVAAWPLSLVLACASERTSATNRPNENEPNLTTVLLTAPVTAQQNDPAHGTALAEEIAAFDAYKAALGDGEGPPDPTALEQLASRHLGTYGAQLAGAALERVELDRLRRAIPSIEVAKFLEGESDHPESFRTRHHEELRGLMRDHLAEQGCETRLGYCAWYVQRYPKAVESRAFAAEIKTIWWHRAHPPWRSKKFAQCAFDCARNCKRQPDPLDDSCYAPCYARCSP